MAKDHWSSNAYNSAAGFVPKLTSKVISYLNAQPGDRILDVGCGDGALTEQIARSTHSGNVLGLDASQSFISTAQEKHSADNCNYELLDCTRLDSYPIAVDGSWDKVFSNAAMHWILRKPDIRIPFFHHVNKALKPGGMFVFEMGANGNVAEIQAATIAALIHAGLSITEATEACPWFFPSTDWMSATLNDTGFDVEICEHEYRSTALTPKKADGSGGLEGWVGLMCSEFVEPAGPDKRESVLREICEVVDPIVTRHEDGSKWIGYCRLRAVARKK